MAELIEFNEETFNKAISSDELTFVDFFAPWCGPCRMMMPHVEEAVEKYAKKVKFGKVNVDEQTDLSRKYRVSSIPFFGIFKGGKIVSTKVGGMSKEDLFDWIDETIKSAK